MISLKKLPEEVILYGAGFLAPDFVHFLKKCEKNIKFILDQKFKSHEEFLGIPARSLKSSSLNLSAIQDVPVIITVVRENLKNEIQSLLLRKGFKQIYWMFELKEYQEYLESFLIKRKNRKYAGTFKRLLIFRKIFNR